MNCNRLNDWIAEAECVSLGRLPDEMRRHAEGCAECGRQLKSLEGFRGEILGIHGSDTEIKEVFENVQNKTGDTTSVQAAPAWQRFLLPAAAVCLVLILAVVFVQGGSRTIPAAPALQTTAAAPAATPAATRPVVPAPAATTEAWAAVSGQGGTVTLPDGSQKPVTQEVTNVPAGSRVELATASSAMRLAYDSGGTIDVTGRGIVQSRPDGFETKDAAFTASFKRGKRGFAVRVPGAVLGVRGTVIGFELQGGNGSVHLIEGNVVVQPEHPDMREFEWKVGQRLALAAGNIEKVIPAREEPKPVAEPAKQPQSTVPAVQPKPEAGKNSNPAPKNPFENRPDAVQQKPDTMTGDGGDGFGGK